MKGAGPSLLVALWQMLEVLTSTTKEAPDGKGTQNSSSWELIVTAEEPAAVNSARGTDHRLTGTISKWSLRISTRSRTALEATELKVR